MVNVPIPSGLPSTDQLAPLFRNLDISSRLMSLQGCPSSFFGVQYQNPVAIVVVAKPTNTNLPFYVPVPNARIIRTVDTISQSDKFTDSSGIFIDCISKIGVGVADYRVQKDNVNFGNGFGSPSNPFTLYSVGLSQPNSNLFTGDINLPCDLSPLPTPVTSGFGSISSIPSITLQTPSFNMPGYGILNPSDIPAGIPISIYINDQRVFSSSITDNRNVIYNLPATLSGILSGSSPFAVRLTPGSTISIYATAQLGSCTKRSQTITVRLPSQICANFITQMDEPSLPPVIAPNTSLLVGIRNIKQVCSDNPNIFQLLNNARGTISIGNLPPVPFDISNGNAIIDLSRVFNISSLIGGR